MPVRFTAQFSRFVLVGLLSNIALYLFYLLFTGLGLGHKLAMSMMYLIGVAQTFIFNRSWAFEHRGATGPALLKYVISYALGYVINFILLWWLVDQLGYPHELVQAAMIVFLALGFFLAQRYWIFRQNFVDTP